MTTKTLPARTRKLMSCWSTRSPKAMVSRSTLTTAASAAAGGSEPDGMEHHGHQGVGEDDQDDAGDHGPGGGHADRGRAPSAADAVIAAGKPDDDREHHGLGEAHRAVREREEAPVLVEVDGCWD